MSVLIKPLEDRVVTRQVEAETVTASGPVTPDMAKEKLQEGTVVVVGPGCVDDKGVRVPTDIKESGKVIYVRHGGTEARYQSEEHITLSVRDLLVVVE